MGGGRNESAGRIPGDERFPIRKGGSRNGYGYHKHAGLPGREGWSHQGGSHPGKGALADVEAGAQDTECQDGFRQDELCLFESGERVQLQVNEAGQYIVPVAQFQEKKNVSDEVMMGCPTDELLGENGDVDKWEVSEDGLVLTRVHQVPRNEMFTPCNEGCPIPVEQLASCSMASHMMLLTPGERL